MNKALFVALFLVPLALCILFAGCAPPKVSTLLTEAKIRCRIRLTVARPSDTVDVDADVLSCTENGQTLYPLKP